MKTRIIETKFWKDPYVASLSVEERLLFLYFLTNEHVNIIHCYEITDREISFDTGLEAPFMPPSRGKFEKDGKMAFYKNYVCLLNAKKYENFSGDLSEKGKVRLLQQLPLDVLKWYQSISPLEAPLKGTISNKQEIISKKNKKKKEYREQEVKVKDGGEKKDFLLTAKKNLVEKFNAVRGTKLQNFPEEVSNGLGYWLSVYPIEDIFLAIENIEHHGYWKDKMTLVLLFRRSNPQKEPVDYIGDLLQARPPLTWEERIQERAHEMGGEAIV